MSDASGTDPFRDERQKGIATAITEVSERASLLIREEIELAKVEVTEKATKLVKGAVVGVAAGVFFVMALVFALVGCAWLLYYYLPVGDFAYFWGFFAMAVILVVLGAIAGFIAAKVVKKGTPPMPSMAIEEARKIRETVSAGSDRDPSGAMVAHPASQPPPVTPGSPIASPTSASDSPPPFEASETGEPPIADPNGAH